MSNLPCYPDRIAHPKTSGASVRLHALGVASLIIALLAAGCGGGSGGASGSTAGGSTGNQTPAAAPTISAQPQDQTINAGASATFSVTATGTAPLSYQWAQDGMPISGATSASYTVANATAQQNGAKFSVTVTNSAGSVTSSSAMLTVVSPPSITAQPQSATVAAGAAVTLTVTATANAPLTYQWQKNGTAISGATSASLAIAAASLDDSGSSYTVTVSDSAGAVTSSAAVLRVTGLKLLAGMLGGVGYADESAGNPRTARFILPAAITFDPATGNFYVLDGNVIREITPTGNVSTLAGSPGLPEGYVDGPGNKATFALPHALAADRTGATLYVADSGNEVIRKVSTSTGAVSLFAGTPAPYPADPNPGNCVPSASNACFGRPNAIAVDPSGNIIVEDAFNQSQIYEFTPTGSFGTLAADTGRALYPSAMAFNTAGTTLVLADDSYVGYLSYPPAPGATVQPIAGAPGNVQGGSSDSAPADTTGLSARFGCVLGGSVWTADAEQLNFVGITYGASGIALNPDGTTAYVADTCNDTIRSVSIPSGITKTLAGVAGSAGTADGTGTSARFNAPTSVTTDSVGNVYVADALNATIRKVTPSGDVSTFAGEASTLGSTDSTDGTGLTARFNQPRGVAVDASGNLYVADTFNHTIRKISPSGAVSLYAGSPGKAGYQDGDALTQALFDMPYGLAIDKAGNLYVADFQNDVIRVISPKQVVSTYAGTAPTVSGGSVTRAFGFQDGALGTARFDNPLGLAIDAAGNLYVSDYINCAIREVVAASNGAQPSVVTVAGKYSPGTPTCASQSAPQADGSGTNGSSPAILGYPTGITVDPSGNVYFASFSSYVKSDGTLGGGATISRLTSPGTASSTVQTIIGSPTAYGGHDDVNSAALFLHPAGLAADAKGDVFVADTDNHVVREITFGGSTATVKTVVGVLEDSTAAGFDPRAPIGVVAGGALPGRLNAPWGIGLLSAGAPDGSGVTLAVTDIAENSVILVNVN